MNGIEPFENWAWEFLASDASRDFRPDVRESGGPALAFFLGEACRRAGGGIEDVDGGHLARALAHDLHGLGLPDSARPQLPRLVAAFLAFLQETGRLSGGAAIGESLLAGALPQEDRAMPSTGRNDPCPCGSGRKHKKCCGN